MNTYDIKRREQRGESTERILFAAICLFGRKGWADTSVKEIADAAEVSIALVFKYFESKEKLLCEAYRFAIKAAYPVPEDGLNLQERVGILIKQSISLMADSPEIFDFFMMLLYTSVPSVMLEAARREMFYNAPIYPEIEKWQKVRELPEGDSWEYFMVLMRTLYANLDFHRKISHLKNGEPVNTCVLLSYIVKLIEEDIKGQGR